jgi:hypothetical protein
MKVGDLVRYCGWSKSNNNPMAIVIESRSGFTELHSRIKVMWVGDELPVQAQVLSVTGKRVSAWVHPKHFEVIISDEQERSTR